jgi:hypothetical protein
MAAKTIVLFSEGAQTRGIVGRVEGLLDQQGMALNRLLTPSELGAGLRIVPIRPGVVDVACLERVELARWHRDLERAEMAVQTFKADRAIEMTRSLEDQLVCLDGIPTRKSLRILYLTRALAFSLEGSGGYELDEAVDQVVGLGTDLPQPLGLSPDLQARLERAASLDTVRIFGAGIKGELFVDGESLASGAVLRGVGKHLVQLVETRSGRVSTAQIWPFKTGRALVWAGELGPAPIQYELDRVLEGRGPSLLLRAVSVALRRTLLVGEVKGGGITLLHVDGRVVSRPSARRAPRLPKVKIRRRTPTVNQPPSTWEFTGGAGLEGDGLREGGKVLRGVGLGLWARVWTPSSFSFGLSTSWLLRPELLAPSEPEFYAQHKVFPLRIGAFWRGQKRQTHPELGLHALAEIGLGEEANRLGLGLSAGLYSPVWQQASLRVQLRTEVGNGWWTNSLCWGVEWSP